VLLALGLPCNRYHHRDSTNHKSFQVPILCTNQPEFFTWWPIRGSPFLSNAAGCCTGKHEHIGSHADWLPFASIGVRPIGIPCILNAGLVLRLEGFITSIIWMFPKIGGFPPKSTILIGFSIINHPFWGTPISWKPPYHVFIECNVLVMDKVLVNVRNNPLKKSLPDTLFL